MKGSNLGLMLENPKQTKGSNLGIMPENPKQNEGIKYGRNTKELESKQRDRIQARCRRTQNKRKELNLGAMQENLKKKGSNLGAIPENPKQNEGIESRRDVGEPKTK